VRALIDAAAPRRRRAPEARTAARRVPRHSLTDCFLLQQIAALRPADSIIVEEAPSSRAPMHDYLPITEPNTFYTCASGGLGHGLPAAVGIALARPDKRVIAVLGDGSSMYSIQGLWSAAQLNLAMTFIIIKNGCYEALYEFGRHFQISRLPGSELPDLDFCGLARSQGLLAIRVDKPAELDRALTAAFQATKPTLVEVVVERAAASLPQQA
jgi:benzoylformate decarboxylase